ncbi:MAG TPA: hypothetical protein VIU61_27170 [Kofleriaceae bacterium]
MATGVLARLIALGIVVAGCYEPTLSDCTVECGASADCANGQVCGTDGFCAAPGVAGSCATFAGPDGGQRDAGPDAASSACKARCPGTCDGDTCVIDCTATDSCQDVTCPSGMPCRVACGDGACRRVRCERASSCEIDCTGQNSCAERVTCGSGSCQVACTGKHACRKGVDCRTACACNAACTGEMSCRDASACPASQCEDDHGCTTDGASCNTCVE